MEKLNKYKKVAKVLIPTFIFSISLNTIIPPINHAIPIKDNSEVTYEGWEMDIPIEEEEGIEQEEVVVPENQEDSTSGIVNDTMEQEDSEQWITPDPPMPRESKVKPVTIEEDNTTQNLLDLGKPQDKGNMSMKDIKNWNPMKNMDKTKVEEVKEDRENVEQPDRTEPVIASKSKPKVQYTNLNFRPYQSKTIFPNNYKFIMNTQDRTQYNLLSPLITDHRGKRIRVITRGEVMAHLYTVIPMKLQNFAGPYEDVEETIYELAINAMIQNGYSSPQSFLYYGNYETMTWNELERLLASYNSDFSDNIFNSRFMSAPTMDQSITRAMGNPIYPTKLQFYDYVLEYIVLSNNNR